LRARKYNKKIEIWQTAPVSDGFGGNITSETLLSSSWCKIITNPKNANRQTDFGETETFDRLSVQLRKNVVISYDPKTMFFKYRGVEYNMVSEPVNIGFEDREVQITVVRKI
jgi:hypothetical protein